MSVLRRGTPVWVRDGWRSVPIFHFWASPHTAACGADLRHMQTALPLSHAEKFARPCKRCVKRMDQS